MFVVVDIGNQRVLNPDNIRVFSKVLLLQINQFYKILLRIVE